MVLKGAHPDGELDVQAGVGVSSACETTGVQSVAGTQHRGVGVRGSWESKGKTVV